MPNGLTREQSLVLLSPFAAKDHEFKNGFIYIDETAICQRIEQVDLSWEFRVESVGRYDPRGALATVVGHLTICGITRSGVGMQATEYRKDKPEVETGEVEKGAATDAMKRAARLFGIGRYLLQCPKDIKDYGPALNKWLASMKSETAAQRDTAAYQDAPTSKAPAWWGVLAEYKSQFSEDGFEQFRKEIKNDLETGVLSTNLSVDVIRAHIERHYQTAQ